MQFQILVRHDAAHRQLAGVANAHQFVAQPRAVGPRAVQRVLQRQAAGMDQRAHHVRLVADALLVAESGHGDWPGRQRAGLTEGPRHGQARQHAITAIQRAGVFHRVDVRAHHQRPGVGLRGGRRKGAKNVADLVHLDQQVQFAHPANQLVAPGLFGIGQRDAGATAVLVIAANLPQHPDLVQQGVAVEREGVIQGGARVHASSPVSRFGQVGDEIIFLRYR